MALRFIAFLAILLSLSGCRRTVEVEKQMTWNCGPKPPDRPSAELELRYVDDPHYYEYLSAKETCRELESAGRKVVSVRFRVWNDVFRQRLQGYTILTIDGKTPKWSDGGGGSLSEGGEKLGPHPLESALR